MRQISRPMMMRMLGHPAASGPARNASAAGGDAAYIASRWPFGAWTAASRGLAGSGPGSLIRDSVRFRASLLYSFGLPCNKPACRMV